MTCVNCSCEIVPIGPTAKSLVLTEHGPLCSACAELTMPGIGEHMDDTERETADRESVPDEPD
jgi:hypothetical protein